MLTIWNNILHTVSHCLKHSVQPDMLKPYHNTGIQPKVIDVVSGAHSPSEIKLPERC